MSRPEPDIADGGPREADGCPCGSSSPLDACCGPILRRLRLGSSDRGDGPSPYGEVRASGAARLWFADRRVPGTDFRSGLSLAARRFWEAAGTPSFRTSSRPRTDGGAPGIPADRHTRPAPRRDEALGGDHRRPRSYGAALHRRLWRGVDRDTRRWIRTTVPPRLRTDPWFGETALDWLLWDAPWLDGRPAMWKAGPEGPGSGVRSDGGRPGGELRPTRARAVVIAALLRSRPSAFRLAGHVEGTALILDDLLDDEVVAVDTPTPPWTDPEDLLVVRTYRYSAWTLAAGTGLLLPRELGEGWVEMLRELAGAGGSSASGAPDDLASSRLKLWALPLLARLVARLTSGAGSPPTATAPDGGRSRDRDPGLSAHRPAATGRTSLPASLVSRRVH